MTKKKINKNNTGKTNDEPIGAANFYAGLARKNLIKLFRDQYGEPYAVLPVEGRACERLDSRMFQAWMWRLISKETGKSTTPETLKSAIKILEGEALFDAPVIDLDVRIANRGGIIFYDLVDGSAVRITKDGWTVTRNTPIIFSKFSHQKVQVVPVRGGDILEIFEFINLPKQNDGLSGPQILFLVWLVFSFSPDCPHPIKVFYGSQGSGKSTADRICKELIDPSRIETLSMPRAEDRLTHIAQKHYYLPLDNLSYIDGDNSDFLCRLVTGAGTSKRKLYTDVDDVVMNFKRVIGLNGINVSPERADLLDRCLLIGLERIESFEGEKDFWARFELAKPRLLGAVFDTLVKALRVIDSIPEPKKLRMADFARFGSAMTEAIGLTREDFLVAYQTNIDRQNDEALSASLVATAMRDVMENEYLTDEENGELTGTPTEFLGWLNNAADRLSIEKHQKMWPQNPHWFVRRLMEVKPNLGRVGILVYWHYRDSNTITIIAKHRAFKRENVADVGDVEPPANSDGAVRGP